MKNILIKFVQFAARPQFNKFKVNSFTRSPFSYILLCVLLVSAGCSTQSTSSSVTSSGKSVYTSSNQTVFNDSITELNDDTFDGFTRQRLVVVKFWATGCGACKIMRPIYNQIAEEMSPRVKFGAIEASKNLYLSTQYGVLEIPAFVIFKDGEEVLRVVGVRSAEQLQHAIETASR